MDGRTAQIGLKTINYLLIILFVIMIINGVINVEKFSNISELQENISKMHYSEIYYVIMQIVQSVCVFLPMTPLTIAGGIIFKATRGLLLAWAGVFIGQIINYLLARKLGAVYINAFPKTGDLIKKVIDKIRSRKGSFVASAIGLYSSGIISFDLLSYSLGFASFNFTKSLIIIAIGIIPKLVLLSFLSGSINKTQGYEIIGSIILVIVAITIMGTALWVNKKRK